MSEQHVQGDPGFQGAGKEREIFQPMVHLYFASSGQSRNENDDRLLQALLSSAPVACAFSGDLLHSP